MVGKIVYVASNASIVCAPNIPTFWTYTCHGLLIIEVVSNYLYKLICHNNIKFELQNKFEILQVFQRLVEFQTRDLINVVFNILLYLIKSTT